MTPAYDFRALARFLRGWLFHLPWTPRRALITLVFLLGYPPFALFTALCLWLDRVVYPGHRRRRVEAPVFIVGNFRSGTTFLHRLLVQDGHNFNSMVMWEILFAPSVVQRRAVSLCRRLDRALGRPGRRLIETMEAHWHRQNVMHRVSLSEPEEDEYLLLHIFSALTIGLSSGLLGQAVPYAWFDEQLPRRDKQRIMGFYRRCMQRHLHAHDAASGVHYLAKNPALCPKLETLLETFPDARIIYLARDPLEALPSFVSMMRFSWRAVGVPADGPALESFLLDMTAHWYRHPLAELDERSGGRHAIVRYDDLVADPAGTVAALYHRLGLPLSPGFRQVLEREAVAARRHSSEHHYGLADLNVTRQEIARSCGDVLARFGWPDFC